MSVVSGFLTTEALAKVVSRIILICTAVFAQSQPALRIVVIEGEDAVNVIQQKTAVAPVIEVRDRNNLPVPGVLVTFSIEGGKAASFGGASTLTVATNAAGQAAVTGLTPSAAGAFQIQVQAAFQGQLATATIAQTNVATAAQAAAAGGGGGLSATTIGIAGAAVAGGAVAATQITRKEDGPQTFSGNFSGQLISTIVSRLNTCVITRTVEASMTVVLDSTEPIRGHAEIDGTDTVVSATCPANVTGRVRERIEELSGTPAAFGFRVTRTGSMPDPLDGGTINGTNTVVLEASLANDVISGQLKFNGNSTKTGEFSNTESSTATFQISLRKTQ
jgi:hypothetical protein